MSPPLGALLLFAALVIVAGILVVLAEWGGWGMKPKRIQRKRTKGWRMPKGAVYVGRPSKWGNPFECSWHYHRWLNGTLEDEYPELQERRRIILRDIYELRGKELACWCHEDESCHADILLELAARRQCDVVGEPKPW